MEDISKNGIKEFTETGITLEDGSHHEFDVIAIATGFVSLALLPLMMVAGHVANMTA